MFVFVIYGRVISSISKWLVGYIEVVSDVGVVIMNVANHLYVHD